MSISPKLYKQALDIQDACNLSGVVHTFSKTLHELHEAGLDTKQIREHPISVLFADKIAHLTDTQSFSENCGEVISKAYSECHIKANICPKCGENFATHNDDGSCVKD